MKKTKLLVFSTHSVFLVSHRLKLLEVLSNECSISIIIGTHPNKIREQKALAQLSRRDYKVFRGIFSYFNLLLVSIFSKKNQIILYIGLPQMILGLPFMVFGRNDDHILIFSGFGTIGHSDRMYTKIAYNLFRKCVVFYSKSRKISAITQNLEDALRVKEELKISKAITVPGSGVELNKIVEKDFDDRSNVIVFASRLIRDKGIYEFVEAAKMLKMRYKDWKFVVCGEVYPKNPTSITSREIQNIADDGSIEYLGHVENVENILSDAKILCHPSYHEGFPKIIAEACASSCAIVTTDVPGCREAVRANYNGFLVDPSDSVGLAKKLEILILDEKLLREFSENSVDLAKKSYDVNAINSKLRNFILGDEYELKAFGTNRIK